MRVEIRRPIGLVISPILAEDRSDGLLEADLSFRHRTGDGAEAGFDLHSTFDIRIWSHFATGLAYLGAAGGAEVELVDEAGGFSLKLSREDGGWPEMSLQAKLQEGTGEILTVAMTRLLDAGDVAHIQDAFGGFATAYRAARR